MHVKSHIHRFLLKIELKVVIVEFIFLHVTEEATDGTNVFRHIETSIKKNLLHFGFTFKTHFETLLLLIHKYFNKLLDTRI